MSIAVSDLSQIFARQIAAKRLNLPPMPGTAAEVMALCQQEDTDAAKLSSVIHTDQTIASNVLRVANSAAYVGAVPCDTLQQAVSRLGLQLITEIAMAVSVRGRMFGNPKCAELLAELWRHSVLTAYFTKEIARMHGRNVETAFLCGLLHDVGKAVLLDNVDRVLGQRDLKIPETDLLAAIAEQHVAGGCVLAEEWGLPEQIAEAIACHHGWTAAARHAGMAMTVCLADQVAHLVGPGVFSPSLASEAVRADPVLGELGMEPEQIDDLLAQGERALLVTAGLQ